MNSIAWHGFASYLSNPITVKKGNCQFGMRIYGPQQDHVDKQLI